MATEYTTGSMFPDVKIHQSVSSYKISWGAIFAGTITALAVELVFTLLGVAIGVNPAEMATLTIGAGLWLLVTTVVSLFIGGFVAAWMSGVYRPFNAVLHGFVVWAFTSLVTFYTMTTPIGNLLVGASSLIGRVIPMTISSVSTLSPQMAQQMVSSLPATALWGLVALLLGAVSACVGGRVGVSQLFAAKEIEAVRKEEKEEEEKMRLRRAG